MRAGECWNCSSWFGASAFFGRKWLSVGLFLFLILVLPASTAQSATLKNGLVLYSLSNYSLYEPVSFVEFEMSARVAGPVNLARGVYEVLATASQQRLRIDIVAATLLIVAQFLLIIGLLWQRARRRKVEAVLRESEKRFRVMANTTPTLIWMCDAQGKITYLNNKRFEFTGADSNAGYGNTWTACIHPDDLKNVIGNFSRALKTPVPFSSEYRLRRRDGVYRWMFDVASPRVNGDASFAGFIGSAIDVTEQRMAQETLQRVSGQLIEAQEKERSRIARDLHDDICQRLALLSVELEQANRGASELDVTTKKRMEEIQQHCSEIARDVQSISHQLHSSKLQYLGIGAAIRGFCKEFAAQYEVKIEVKEENVPSGLPTDISLCLFRVAQEALHNAVKYSGTRQFAVELTGTANEVRLVVKDTGAGFNVEGAKRKHGLGLLSMQERVHLVYGRLCVESAPGMGTRIVAAVPLAKNAGATPSSAANEHPCILGAA
jgi:PAS domain S-box-containing protein